MIDFTNKKMNSLEEIIDKINRSILDEDDIKNVVDVLKSGLLSRPAGGPIIHKFQDAMAKLHNKKYAYATSSGTSALHLAIASLGLKPKDEVIVPALANIADCSVIMQEGAKVIFADIDKGSFNIDPEDIKRKISSKTKAIIVVHMYGQPADMNLIREIASKNKIILIEDCAQAAGAKFEGKYVGSFGDLSCFSFYQTKHIITGEGGMVLTDNAYLYRAIDSLANNGIMKENIDLYDYDRIGFNYQMTEIQAALGIGQLKKLDKMNETRCLNADIYKKNLGQIGITFQKTIENSENVYFYLTGLLPKEMVTNRNRFLEIIKNENVPIKSLYPLILPKTKLLKMAKFNDCPVAEDVSKRLFNLYVNPGLTKQDIVYFCSIIKKVYNKLNK